MGTTTRSELAARRAVELFHSGFCCSESVLLTLAEWLDERSDALPRIATGFCGGMANTRGVCGAVNGAVMGLGLAQGRNVAGAPRDALYASVQHLVAAFRERWGSLECHVLLDCDLGTAEGQRQFEERDLRTQRCDKFVADAVRMALGRLERAKG